MVVLMDRPGLVRYVDRGDRRIIYLSGPLVNARHVDSRDELDGRWLVWVFIPTVEIDTVDAVFVGALRWSEQTTGKGGLDGAREQSYVRRA